VFVDAEGRPLTPSKLGSGRSMTVLEREGQPVAALVHDSAVLEDPGLLEAVASAAQLAAANARLPGRRAGLGRGACNVASTDPGGTR
jgi:hypothetical protein